MPKKIAFFIWMVALVGLSVYSIVLLNRTQTAYDVDLDRDIIRDVTLDVNERYKVERGDIVEKIDVSGCVMEELDGRLIYVVEGKESEREIYVKPSDIIDNQAVFAKSKNKELKAVGKLCCIGVDNDSDRAVVTFLDYSKLYIECKVPERVADTLKIGQIVNITHSDEKIKGTVSFIDVFCDNGNVSVKIAYDSINEFLRVGSYCDVEIVLEEEKDVLLVPLECIVYIGSQDMYKVYVKDSEGYREQTVSCGIIGEDYAEIVLGLNENDEVIYPVFETTLRYYLQNK